MEQARDSRRVGSLVTVVLLGIGERPALVVYPRLSVHLNSGARGRFVGAARDRDAPQGTRDCSVSTK